MATGNQIARREMARAITKAIDSPAWALVMVTEQPDATYMSFELERDFVDTNDVAPQDAAAPTRVVRVKITAAPDLDTP